MKEQITEAMDMLAADSRTVFVGYGLRTGRAMGTLKNVPEEQLIEFPVAEGLMVSAAIGMSLMGLLPVIYFERMDFMMNAMDALVNHLLAAEKLSHGEFKPALIIRATVGNKTKPNFTGPVHTQDFTDIFREIDVFYRKIGPSHWGAEEVYQMAIERRNDGESSIVIEYKDDL